MWCIPAYSLIENHRWVVTSIDVDGFPEGQEVTDSGQMICSCVDPGGAVCTPLRVERLDAEASASLAAGFKALGDPHRVTILHLLAAAGQPVCVVDVERHFDLAQSTISYHLKTLVDAGVIARERRGKWSYYSIIDQRLADLGGGIETLVARSATST